MPKRRGPRGRGHGRDPKAEFNNFCTEYNRFVSSLTNLPQLPLSNKRSTSLIPTTSSNHLSLDTNRQLSWRGSASTWRSPKPSNEALRAKTRSDILLKVLWSRFETRRTRYTEGHFIEPRDPGLQTRRRRQRTNSEGPRTPHNLEGDEEPIQTSPGRLRPCRKGEQG